MNYENNKNNVVFFNDRGIIVDNFMVDIGGKLEGNIGEFIS